MPDPYPRTDLTPTGGGPPLPEGTLAGKKGGEGLKRTAAALIPALLASCTPSAVTPTPETPPPPTSETPAQETKATLTVETFSLTQGYPQEFSPYFDVLGGLAKEDNLSLPILDQANWIKAQAGETKIDYALMPFATVTGLTDPDDQLSTPKPVYYLAYPDDQGTIQGGYAVGKLIETDEKGKVSFTARMVDLSVFESWKDNTQAPQTKLGQLIYAIPLKEGVTVEQARQILEDFIAGKITQEELLSKYAIGLSFIQPEKPDNFVSITLSAGQPATPEPNLLQQAFNKLLGATPAAAAALEYSATPAPTPTETATPEPIPTIAAEGIPPGVPDLVKISEDEELAKQYAEEVAILNTSISEFVNAFNLNSTDVLVGLHPEIEKPEGMPEFITMRTTDGVALMMATKNENNEWVWQKACLLYTSDAADE